MELDCDYVYSGRTTIPREVDSVAADSEASAMRVFLFRAIVYTDAHIHDVLEPGEGDFILCGT